MTAEEFSDRDREILEFERLRWRHVGTKEAAVLDKFDMSLTRYYQVLGAIIERPEALAYDAQLVNRLLRLREGRRQQRIAGRA